ncbi:copper chaperone [Pseudomonas sp. PvR086]|jgi:copper chaperone|uniref:Copper chaperone n=1 Tax=Pseudomonas umsongensis TaxID=198618 RepID=A0ACC5MHB5_9PSED|nr:MULTISPECIES: cation transporter [Pseudomonas]PNB77169.1 copper chaperone [Pseudomonas sp. FW305-BF6]ANI58223.1 copper chaperone CopZ [Pseudomonas sp. GR 6-02]MBB2887950.1 copper chaperone [Pseudomonas umsongensis]MBD9609685.1 heavy-metal-associated domain-containing protein [Pseudomonas sp. PDM08]MBD9621219.1 heavy-metal-associated domain-containing protein [Pseudomonas sp. PDM07]
MQVFNVEGMSCGHCVKAITEALQAKDPAASVRIDLAAKEVGVESVLTADQVIAAITEEGYGVKQA